MGDGDDYYRLTDAPTGWGILAGDHWITTDQHGGYPAYLVFATEAQAADVASQLRPPFKGDPECRAARFGPLDGGERAELERLRAALPKTADGVPIVPGMTVYGTGGATDRVGTVSKDAGSPDLGIWTDLGVERPFYSTREAATAADASQAAPLPR